jgi:hypothetical protein
MKCCVCFESWNEVKIPHILSCGHDVCGSCCGCITNVRAEHSSETQRANWISCPTCTRLNPIPKSGISVNFSYRDILEKATTLDAPQSTNSTEGACEDDQSPLRVVEISGERKGASAVCHDCKQHALGPSDHLRATVSCNDCKVRLCFPHFLLHGSLPSTQSHTIQPLHGAASRCSEHIRQLLDAFCLEHDTPLCPLCVPLKHPLCTIVSINVSDGSLI